MKKILIVSLLTLLTRIIAFSSTTLVPTQQDSIVYITATNIKYANLIFAEHKKMLVENELLHKQLDNYRSLNSQLIHIDSLRRLQVENYKELNESRLLQIEKLNKKVRIQNNHLLGWQIGGVVVSVGLVLLLLLK